MAYLELSKEAYNDIIQAAGIKGSKVARVCEEQGVWSAEAKAEAPDDVAVPEGSVMAPLNEEKPAYVTPTVTELVEKEETTDD